MRSFLLVLLFSTTSTFAQVVIKGKIHNYDGGSEIAYYPTLDSIYAPVWRNINPKSNGTFKIKYENKGFGTTTIHYNYLTYRFLHDSNSEIYFEIDQEKINLPEKHQWKKEFHRDSVKQLATIAITGDYHEINKFYNRNIRTSYSTTTEVGGNYYSVLMYRTKNPGQLVPIIDSLIQQEVKQINELNLQITNENYISNQKEVLKEFLKNEVKAFYTAVFFNAIFHKKSAQKRLPAKDSTADLTFYNAQWEKLTEEVLKNALKEIKPNTPSKDYQEYLKSLSNNLRGQYKLDYYAPIKLPDEYVHGALVDPDSAITSSLDTASLFAKKLLNLWLYLGNEHFYSPVLLNAIKDLKEAYPNSAHLAYFEPQIKKLEQYVMKAAEDFNKAKVIETNYTSFSDLLEEFKGQNVLVDIWATWCLPCIKGFKNKAVLEPYTSSDQLTVLYISIDKPQWEDRWRENIRYNELAGYHIRANNELKDDLWNTIGGEKGTIPRYVLIDKEGKIYKSTANKPGDGEKFTAEIESLIISQD